jgi:hypothetical protein
MAQSCAAERSTLNKLCLPAKLLHAANGDTDELYASLLSASANILVNGLINKATAGLSKKFEMHHIFSKRKDLAEQFKEADIDISKFLVRLERSVHKGVHQGGKRGGDWNADWEAFLNTKGKPRTKQQRVCMKVP